MSLYNNVIISIILLESPYASTDVPLRWDVIELVTQGRTPTTTLGVVQLRSATLFFLWASLYSEPMPACSVALALGDGGIVRRIAMPQALALSSVLGRSLVSMSS